MTGKILEYFRLLRTIRASLGNKIKLLHCAAGALVKAFSISKAQIGAIVLQLRNKLSPQAVTALRKHRSIFQADDTAKVV